MSKNARGINYRLRVAKSVERRMMCTAFQKLAVILPLEVYQYVGFGAYYFTDFYLFHRELGINDMISIEDSEDPNTPARYNFNKPFDCIEILFKNSSEVLDKLEYTSPKIVWLDCTDGISSDILSQLATLIRRLKSGSVIVISLNASPNQFDNEEFSKLEELKRRVGASQVPSETKLSDFATKTICTVFNKILKSYTDKIIYERNQGGGPKISFKQIFNFKYSDGALMHTFGGIILDDKKHLKDFEKIKFYKIPFLREGNSPFEIKVPKLTLKEIKHLESIMPLLKDEWGQFVEPEKIEDLKIGLSENDIDLFSKIYKYYPTFIESRLG